MSKPLLIITHRFDRQTLLQAQMNESLPMQVQYVANVFDTPENLQEARALIVRSGLEVGADLLKKFPNLEVVVTATAGFDHLDLKALTAAGVTAYHVPGPQAQAAAELTLTHLFQSQRRWREAQRQLQAGEWRREDLLGRELRGRTFGILGLGRVGTRVAEMAQALGLHVAAHDPYRIDHDPRFEMLGFEELMRSADIVSMHVPLTGLTRQMINGRTLEWMAPDATLINMSRGEVINEDELIEHLCRHRNFHACLDVFQNEPLSKDSRLLQLSNVTLSPHIGASTVEALQRSSQEALLRVAEFFSGQASEEGLLPPKATWFLNDKKRR